ncbi:uncharacterized protein [Littorina saxatilis]
MWTNNSTAGNDSTGLLPVRDDDADRKHIVAWMQACVVVYSAFTVLIIVLNLFLLVVVLSSSSLRSNLRNKFLLNLVVCHLLEGVTGTAFDAEFYAESVWKHGCYVHFVRLLLHLFVMDFVLWWGVVALLLHYLARLLRYEGPGWFLRLPPKLQRAALQTAVALPWLVAVAVLAYVLLTDANVSIAVSLGLCRYFLTDESFSFKTFICFYLPLPTLVVLLIAVQIAYRFKSARTEDGRSGERTLEDGESMVYMLTGGLTILLLSPLYVVFAFNIDINPLKTRYVVFGSLMMVASLLSIVQAPLWLLMLRDVKERCVQLVVKMPLCCRWFASCANKSTRSGSTSVAFSNLQEE